MCGDGRRYTVQCDDANNNNNDGCSMDCKVEVGFICSGGSPDSKDACTKYVPSEVSLIQTSQAHLYRKIIINVRANFLPQSILSLLTQCKTSCLNILRG